MPKFWKPGETFWHSREIIGHRHMIWGEWQWGMYYELGLYMMNDDDDVDDYGVSKGCRSSLDSIEMMEEDAKCIVN